MKTIEVCPSTLRPGFSTYSPQAVKDLERGVGNPSLQTLQKILDVVGMEMVLQVKQTVK